MSLKTAAGAVLTALLVLAPTPAAAHVYAPPAPQLTRAPEMVGFVPADYPESEKAAGRQAAVVLRLHIDVTGAVVSAEVTESAGPAFDAAAVAAALKFRFSPAEVDGKPSAIKIAYRYEFQLAPAAPTTAAFHGVIKRRGTGAPVQGVTVTVTAPGLAAPAVAVTDAAGRFQFADLPRGQPRSPSPASACQRSRSPRSSSRARSTTSPTRSRWSTPSPRRRAATTSRSSSSPRRCGARSCRRPCAPRRPARSRAPRATSCAWSRACPAWPAAPRARVS
ncbi:TonB family protein [Nannocystis pusilla]|uniref:TonB family protein n=1 Tax=Nannocystis pusilla TaxID=889268 RepID=UPI003B798C25